MPKRPGPVRGRAVGVTSAAVRVPGVPGGGGAVVVPGSVAVAAGGHPVGHLVDGQLVLVGAVLVGRVGDRHGAGVVVVAGDGDVVPAHVGVLLAVGVAHLAHDVGHDRVAG